MMRMGIIEKKYGLEKFNDIKYHIILGDGGSYGLII